MSEEKVLPQTEEPKRVQKELIRPEEAAPNTPTTAGCSHNCANCPTPCHF